MEFGALPCAQIGDRSDDRALLEHGMARPVRLERGRGRRCTIGFSCDRAPPSYVRNQTLRVLRAVDHPQMRAQWCIGRYVRSYGADGRTKEQC